MKRIWEVKTLSSDGPELFCRGVAVTLCDAATLLNQYEVLKRKVEHGCTDATCRICDGEQGDDLMDKEKRRRRRNDRERRLRQETKKDPHRAEHRIDTRTPCSCWMCRSPRHNRSVKPKDRLTMQERKADAVHASEDA